MKLKKLAAFSLALVAALSFSGCSKEESAPQKSTAAGESTSGEAKTSAKKPAHGKQKIRVRSIAGIQGY